MTKVLRVLLAVARGAHTLGAVCAATGLPAMHVGALLRYSLGRGDLTRAGPRGRYRYRHVDPLARLQALADSINPPLTVLKDGACILSPTRYVGDIETETNAMNLKRQIAQAKKQMRMNDCFSPEHQEALRTLRALRCDLYEQEKYAERNR